MRYEVTEVQPYMELSTINLKGGDPTKHRQIFPLRVGRPTVGFDWKALTDRACTYCEPYSLDDVT
jgi:hypothetical protein